MKNKLYIPLIASGIIPQIILAGNNKPNIVVFLIDDLGWGELPQYGNTFNETPNIDNLAKEGMIFTNAYAAPVSSPTRACYHTGEYSPRHGICDYLPEVTSNYLDPAKHETLNEALQNVGYYTGLIGKWHLDTDFINKKGGPVAHGFDWVFGTETKYIAEGDYFYPYNKISTITDAQPNEFLADRLCREASTFMTNNKDKPFFLSVQLYSVHETLDAPADLVAKYKAKYDSKYGEGKSAYFDTSSPKHSGFPDNPYMAAMLEKVDGNVGKLIQKIKDLGLDNNTIFILCSDNGGDEYVANNGGLRGAKTWLYEGGIRVPMIIRYPGKCIAGSVCDTPVSIVDFYPTFLDLAGNATTSEILDGVSITPLFQNGSLNRDELYWYYPAGNPDWNDRKGCAIRKGDFKLIYRYGLGPDYYELYDLKNDPFEKNNIIQTETAKADELKSRLDIWMADMKLAKWKANEVNKIYDFETDFPDDYGTKGDITSPPQATTDQEDQAHNYFVRSSNPHVDELNPTATVGKFKRSKMGYWWAYAWFNFPSTYIAASEANPKYLHVLVYKPLKSTICAQLVGINNASTYEIQTTNKQINKWEDMVFEITTPDFFSQLQFKADFVKTDNPPYPNRLTDDVDIYFDEIIINDDPTPRGGGIGMEKEHKIIDFESGFSGKWGTNANPNGLLEDHETFSVVDNPNKTDTNNSDKVGLFRRKTNGLWWAYAWFNFDTISIQTNPMYLHVMVNKPLISTICVQVKDRNASPVYNTGEIKSDGQTKINEWQDVVFKVTTTGDFCYFEFKPDFINQTPATRLQNDINIYFDDIIINNSSQPRESIALETGLLKSTSEFQVNVVPESISGIFSIINNNISPTFMQVYNMTGELLLHKKLVSGKSRIDLSTRTNGIYLIKIFSGSNSKLMKFLKI